jgi:hypothetical protein
MSNPRLLSVAGKVVEEGVIRKFEAGLRGQVILPTGDAYDLTRWSWNRAIDRRPGMIVRCAGTEDVVRAVDFARSNELLVAVRSGGHSFAGHSTCDDGMVIDFSAMKGIYVDPKNCLARAEAGVRVGEFDRATQALGLATVMGGCEDVGIAGFTLGGGEGLLTSRYGLGCDNLVSLEIVSADGRLLTASAQENQDLFWGMRGGAGNFGIAAALEYRLHPVSKVFAGAVTYPIGRARPVLRSWRDYASDPPDELTTVFGALMLPEGPMIGIVACYCGDLDKGEKVLQPLGSFGSALMNSLGPMSYLDFQHSLEALNPSEASAHRKSNVFKELTDESIDIIVDYVGRAPRSSFIGLFPYRGAVCRVGASETAFPIRERAYDLWIDSYWQQPSEAESSLEWTNGFWRAMRPFTTGAVYVKQSERRR